MLYERYNERPNTLGFWVGVALGIWAWMAIRVGEKG